MEESIQSNTVNGVNKRVGPPYQVYCNSCKSLLYIMTVEPETQHYLSSWYLKSADERVPKPMPNDRIECPICHKYPFILTPYGIKLLTERGILPR